MSGHSKWSKVKPQKATPDVVKAKIFTKAIHAIMVAVSLGGNVTDPSVNVRLRLAIAKAQEANVPKDTISRVIQKASQSRNGALEEVVYEAYGPGGCALFISAATDNKNRLAGEIKNVLHRHSARLATPGSVRYLFQDQTPIQKQPLSREDATRVDMLVADLEALDDTQHVFTNQ